MIRQVLRSPSHPPDSSPIFSKSHQSPHSFQKQTTQQLQRKGEKLISYNFDEALSTEALTENIFFAGELETSKYDAKPKFFTFSATQDRRHVDVKSKNQNCLSHRPTVILPSKKDSKKHGQSLKKFQWGIRPQNNKKRRNKQNQILIPIITNHLQKSQEISESKSSKHQSKEKSSPGYKPFTKHPPPQCFLKQEKSSSQLNDRFSQFSESFKASQKHPEKATLPNNLKKFAFQSVNEKNQEASKKPQYLCSEVANQNSVQKKDQFLWKYSRSTGKNNIRNCFQNEKTFNKETSLSQRNKKREMMLEDPFFTTQKDEKNQKRKKASVEVSKKLEPQLSIIQQEPVIPNNKKNRSNTKIQNEKLYQQLNNKKIEAYPEVELAHKQSLQVENQPLKKQKDKASERNKKQNKETNNEKDFRQQKRHLTEQEQIKNMAGSKQQILSHEKKQIYQFSNLDSNEGSRTKTINRQNFQDMPEQITFKRDNSQAKYLIKGNQVFKESNSFQNLTNQSDRLKEVAKEIKEGNQQCVTKNREEKKYLKESEEKKEEKYKNGIEIDSEDCSYLMTMRDGQSHSKGNKDEGMRKISDSMESQSNQINKIKNAGNGNFSFQKDPNLKNRAPILSLIYGEEKKIIQPIIDKFQISTEKCCLEVDEQFLAFGSRNTLVQRAISLLVSLDPWLINRIFEPYLSSEGNATAWLYCLGCWRMFSNKQSISISLFLDEIIEQATRQYFEKELYIEDILKMITGLRVMQLANKLKKTDEIKLSLKKGSIIWGVPAHFSHTLHRISDFKTTVKNETLFQLQNSENIQEKDQDNVLWLKQKRLFSFFKDFFVLSYRKISFWTSKKIFLSHGNMSVYTLKSLGHFRGGIQIQSNQQFMCSMALYRQIKPKVLKLIGKIKSRHIPVCRSTKSNPPTYCEFSMRGKYYLFLEIKGAPNGMEVDGSLCLEGSQKIQFQFLEYVKIQTRKNEKCEYVEVGKNSGKSRSMIKEQFVDYLTGKQKRGKQDP